MYDLNTEPGHEELFESVVHVDLAEYQIGADHYERLQEQLALAQRFTMPSQFTINL